MTITRPTVMLNAGLTFKPVSKSAVSLAKHVADDALDATSAVKVAEVFEAIEATEQLIETHQKMLSEAQAAVGILRDGEVPEGVHGDLVTCAKRIHDLSEALDRPRDIEIERAEDLAAGLAHDLDKAKTAHERAIKRAQYAFAKVMASGFDPAMMSKASRHAHPPATFSEHDLDYEYAPGTRILKGVDREFPAEDTDPDTMTATMVAVICEDVLAKHQAQAERKAAHEELSERQRERLETQQAAEELVASIRESI